MNSYRERGASQDCPNIKEPKLIESIETEKIIKISAGDKHSACINFQFELFVWGCCKNGKLGYDSHEDAKEPTIVEDLQDYTIVDVSCGPMHTIATASDGKVFTFGHGEEEDTPFPTKVQFPAQKNVKISQCLAGYLISIALDFNEDKIYTWGYAGRGILGRVVQNNNKTPEKTSLKLCKSQVIQKYKTKVLREIMGENALTKLQSFGSVLKVGPQEDEMYSNEKVDKVAIGSMNTLILTDKGKLLIFGSDEYNQ